ncbi:type IV pilus biogenesis protein PilP [Sodalis endosymbiont of Spalangia cameroni]|uniref:type IV pilus biogenesis protein PilP n=1 Tax=Sodalis praecaptivus TaxID=1239307 RepID=UPI0031F791D7
MVRRNVCCAGIILFASMSAMAAGEVKTVGDLDVLQSERVYYELLAAANRAKAEASQPLMAGRVYGGSDGAGAPRATLPDVVKIFGNGKTMKVTLRDAGGRETVNQAGDVIAGTLKIARITLNGVETVHIETGKTVMLN